MGGEAGSEAEGGKGHVPTEEEGPGRRGAQAMRVLKVSMHVHRAVTHTLQTQIRKDVTDVPGGPVDKQAPAGAGGTGSIPGSGRFHVPWSH